MRSKFRLFKITRQDHSEVPVENTFGEIAIILMEMMVFLLLIAVSFLAAIAAPLREAARDQRTKDEQIADLKEQLDKAISEQKGKDEHIAHLEHRLDGLESKAIGQIALDATINAKEVQKLNLLLAWDEVRSERPLHKLLLRRQSAQQIVLAEDERALPTDEWFVSLQKEATRIYRAEDQRGVSAAEVARLLGQVSDRAGFGPTGLRKGINTPALLGYGKGAKIFHADVLHKDNLDCVAEKIRHTLLDDRKTVGELQQRLINQIALARLGKPSAKAKIDPRETLRSFVVELDNALELLPEIVDRQLAD
jgi:hypothetical protein